MKYIFSLFILFFSLTSITFAQEQKEIPIPLIHPIEVKDLSDTWGEARSHGRTHEGIDIVVPRWSFIASPVEGTITRIETSGFGGLHIWMLTKDKERFYFAHLEAVSPFIKVGDKVEKAEIIGFVGNSGNALGTDPHLHFGIYTNDWVPENPYPRITETFSEKDQEESLTDFLSDLKKLISKIKKSQK
jgi:peptidoglycan LD-endopeptidase LytH